MQHKLAGGSDIHHHDELTTVPGLLEMGEGRRSKGKERTDDTSGTRRDGDAITTGICDGASHRVQIALGHREME